MFELIQNIFKEKKGIISEEDLCGLLNTNPEALKKFEDSYSKYTEAVGISDNIFKVNSRQIAAEMAGIIQNAPTGLDKIMNDIVDELIAQTAVYTYDGTKQEIVDFRRTLPQEECVAGEDVKKFPREFQPDCTGYMARQDLPDSGKILAATYKKYITEKNPASKMAGYNCFRQGLDILDIDPLTYAMIDQNPNSMGYWLPKIADTVTKDGFFKIPATKIIKVPMTLLQLTRLEYRDLTRVTLDIVNEYCKRVFDLNTTGDYFIKTGTYSSKYDFRNARVNSPKEIMELGEYLLFIHWQALQMAHYDLSGKGQPVIYGVSTTTEWVVRNFITDSENNLTIYHGLPLRTEYRMFVDFDTDKVLGIHPYWDSNVVKRHFEKTKNDDPDAFHDHVTFTLNEDRLNKRYQENAESVMAHFAEIIPEINMQGQWSVDIMQNGSDFWLIDMAKAEDSAYYTEVIPEKYRRPAEENWLPDLSDIQ